MSTDYGRLSNVFKVQVKRKIRDYEVTLQRNNLHLKPVEANLGRRINIRSNETFSCHRDKSDNPKYLFKLNAFDGKSLKTKSYVFLNIKDANNKDIKELTHLWVEAISKVMLLPKKRSRPRKVLVLVNPAAGKGNAVSLCYKVEKVFKLANIDYEVLVTERSGHAEEYLKTQKSISQLGSILILSGDGLVFEALNGLYDREDGKFLLHTIAIGVMPCGSGNALVRCLQHMREEDPKDGYGLLNSIQNTLKGRPTPMDLMRVVSENANPRMAFLSVGWGIIADIDIESEHLRYLGGLRFQIWALKRVAQLRKYRGKISYLRAATHKKYIGSDIESSSYMRSETNLDTLIPDTLDDKLGPEWIVEENEFVCVYVMNMPFIDSNTFAAPESRLNDGLLWLMIVRKEASKMNMLQALAAIEKGRHHQVDNIELRKVKAVRIEPEVSGNKAIKGHITADGELINYGRVQVSVLPSAGRVMMK